MVFEAFLDELLRFIPQKNFKFEIKFDKEHEPKKNSE